MKKNNMFKMLMLGIPLLFLAACGEGNDNAATPASAAPASQQITLATRQQDIYDTNCAVCHGMTGSGAPQSGVITDWQKRSGKGMDTMLNNAMDGFQAMPAMGGCFDCEEEDFRQLITFMTSGILE